jgi:DNA-binding transcriptional LysR family regulator
LLRREDGAVALTAAGEVFCPDAERILTMATGAIAHARRSHEGMTRVCRVGTLPPELTGDLFARALGDLSRTHPEIAIEFHELTSSAQREALVRGVIDVGLASTSPEVPEAHGIASVTLFENPLECALISTAHPLAERVSVSPADLAAFPFLLVDQSGKSAVYDLVTESLGKHGLSPDAGGAFNSPRALWRLIADSASWTIATRSQHRNPPHGLMAIPIDGVSIPLRVGLLWRAADADPTAKIVVDAIARAASGGRGFE